MYSIPVLVYSCVGSPIYQRRYKMNVIKRICFFAIFLYTSLFTSVAIAVDTYDASTNKLTIPSVAVGDTLYSNVVISVGSVISASTTAKADSYDTYDFSSGKLSIPVVVVGTNIYYSVVVTVGNIFSVGDSCIGVKVCYAAALAQAKVDADKLASQNALSVMNWSYLSTIQSGNGLGNVADASLVQTSNGAVRVYFKNGNDPMSNMTGFDNLIHSAVSNDAGLTWSIESGVRIPIGSPVEVLPKSGGGYQAWGWNIGVVGDPMYYAESSDGLNFVQVSIAGLDKNKCLTSAGISFGPLGDPSIVLLADGSWLLHAQGVGVGNTGPTFARWACVATSPDGKTWSPVQSRSYGGSTDVSTNPTIYKNNSGKIEWWWPTSLGSAVRIGDGTTFGDTVLTVQGGDPERLDLADGTEMLTLGGFDNRAGGALIFLKRATSPYTITKVQSMPEPGYSTPNAKLTWTVVGSSSDKITVMNLCLQKNIKDLPGGSVTFSSSGNTLTVTAIDPNNSHTCTYILVGAEKIIG